MEVKRCKVCNAPMPVRSKVCPKCHAGDGDHAARIEPSEHSRDAEFAEIKPVVVKKGLIQCKGCGELISKKAGACPHCGEPAKKKTSGCTWVIAIVVILPMFAAFIVGTYDESTKPVVQKVADTPESKAKCLTSADCIFEKYAIDAEVYCPEYIQKYAQYNYKWTDGLLGYKFTKVSVVSGGPVVRFFGDKLQIQNSFGAWSNVVYSCDFDTESESVVSANAEIGRL